MITVYSLGQNMCRGLHRSLSMFIYIKSTSSRSIYHLSPTSVSIIEINLLIYHPSSILQRDTLPRCLRGRASTALCFCPSSQRRPGRPHPQSAVTDTHSSEGQGACIPNIHVFQMQRGNRHAGWHLVITKLDRSKEVVRAHRLQAR